MKEFVSDAAKRLDKDSQVLTVKDLQTSHNLIEESIKAAIVNSDLVIGNMDGGNVGVTFSLGIAASLEKPILLIVPSDRALSIPEQLLKYSLFIFSMSKPELFTEGLRSQIEKSLKPESSSISESMKQIFISYSHRDAEFLQRLMVHLKPLERANLVESWSDTRLRTGDLWREQIDIALGRSRAAILLLSADFMASDFIIDNELPPLLEKAETQGTKIFSLIVKPCRFSREPSLSRFQAANDPRKPLISLGEGEQEEIYDKLTLDIENFLRH